MDTNFPRDQLRVVLIAVFVLLCLLRERSPGVRKAFSAALALLTCLGFFAHFNLFEWHPGKVHLHNLEMYHYFMGTKYFKEVGYTKLYEASLIADSLDDPYFRPELSIRSMETYEIVPRRPVLDKSAQIISAFRADRWAAFRRDLAVFRATAPTNWGARFSYLDHGYNGTPLITWILGTLSSLSSATTEDFIAYAAWWDVALVLSVGAGIALLVGGEAAILFLFMTALNPLNDYGMIGGAYLRYLSFSSLALGIACYRRDLFVPSGFLFAASGLLRIFPLLFWGVLAAALVLERERPRAWLRTRRFHLSFCGSAIALLMLTSTVTDPSGRNPWLTFGEQIQRHGEGLSLNRIGLKTLFQYSEEKNLANISRVSSRGALDWVRENQVTFDQRRPLYVAALLVIVAFLAWFLRAARGTEALVGGLLLCFAGLALSHYYYLFLSLIPLMVHEKKGASLMTATTFGVMTALATFSPFGSPLDRRFFFISALTLILLASFALVRIRSSRDGSVKAYPEA